MKNAYIIPTLGRKSVGETTKSIYKVDKRADIYIMGGRSASQSRNVALNLVTSQVYDWIFFIDDDDYYQGNFIKELDANYSIIVFKMLQYGREIPDKTNKLEFNNVGINFAFQPSRFSVPRFTEGFGEDYRFLKELLDQCDKTYKDIKITNDIYYYAPKQGNYLPHGTAIINCK